jgi:hypothetical protein
MGFSGVISTTSPKSSAYDVSARGFFIAQSDAGVTLTDTQKNATNQLVLDLKAAGLWTKMKAVYPMVGGTATSHKFNLITPADTDAAFRLSFVGGGTHSANGYQPGGVNGYANTFLSPSNVFTDYNSHLSYYSRTTTVGTAIEIGNINSLSGTIILHLRTATNFVAGSTSSVTSFTTTGSALGFWLGSKRSNSDRETYLNGTTQTTVTTSDTTVFNNFNIYLGASNVAGTANLYSAKECAFASIGEGLTDAEALALYNAVQNFNTTLGRQV